MTQDQSIIAVIGVIILVILTWPRPSKPMGSWRRANGYPGPKGDLGAPPKSPPHDNAEPQLDLADRLDAALEIIDALAVLVRDTTTDKEARRIATSISDRANRLWRSSWPEEARDA